MILNILKYGVSEGLAKLAPFLTTLYVAKFLSPEMFGKYSLVIVLFEIFFILISFNIQATTRIDYFKESSLKFKHLKQNHFIISIVLASVGGGSLFFLEREDQFIVSIIIVSALLRTGSVFILAIFQCSKKVNAYIYSNIAFVFVLSLSIFVFLNMGSSYHSWLFAMLVASVVQFLLVLKLYGVKSFKLYWPEAITFRSLKFAFIPAVLFMPQAIGWWLKSGADRFLINEYLGSELLGNYSLAFQLASILIIFVSTINLAVVPLINENLKKRNIDYVLKILSLMGLCCTLFTVFLYFINIEILNALYEQTYPLAKEMMLYLCISNLFQAFLMIYINVLYFENKGMFVAKVIFLGFVLQVAFNFQLLYFFDKGVIEMILSSVLFNFVILIVLLNKTRKIITSYRGHYV